MARLAFAASLALRTTSLIPRALLCRPARSRLPPCAPRKARSPTLSATPATTTSRTRQPSPPPDAPLFQCPVCQTALPPTAPLALSSLPPSCATCANPFEQRDGYVDLTPTRVSPSAPAQLPLPVKIVRNFVRQPPGQGVFQLPMVSYAYERGWRQQFAAAGFPGVEKEFDYLLDFVLPADAILDISCGSGLMSRRLATSGEFRRVVAADYSDTMLRETVAQARRDVTVPEFDVVRADVARLPFVTGGFDAAHSGAALHCWPSVQDGLREVLRVLKPGGKFVATTFLKGAYWPGRDRIMASSRVRRAVLALQEAAPSRMGFRFFEEDELKYLFQAAGFTDVDLLTNRGFVLVRCRKPE